MPWSDPELYLVLATVIGGFAFASVVGGWAARSLPIASAVLLLVAVGLIFYLHEFVVPGGLTWRSIPDAFIDIVARVVN